MAKNLFCEVLIIPKDLLINENIKSNEVRLIDANGDDLGIMQLKNALKLSSAGGLDLVEIAPNSTPPVCRIMDFGKFIYDKQKKEKTMLYFVIKQEKNNTLCILEYIIPLVDLFCYI